MLAKLRLDLFLIALILISAFVCYTNYTPGTILSGWDTIHPEFNMSQYMTRITSVWQEQQGLGAAPSQAHASEIPRMAIYSILLTIFPLNFVRFAYIFLMIIMGPVGVYLFIRYVLRKEHPSYLVSHISAFLGGLFYLLNVGTVQHFIVILEMFATKYGFLGFIFLYATRFMDTGKKTDLIIFSLLLLFSSSMAHTATLWYIFYGGLILYIWVYAYKSSPKIKEALKKSVILSSVALFINLYWILPNLYYSFYYSKDVINSKIHRLFTEEAYLYNKSYGNIADLLIFRNFLFQWRILENSDTFSAYLMAAWTKHLSNPAILFIGYFFSFLTFCGMFLASRKKRLLALGVIPITILTGFFLLSNVPVVTFVVEFLRDHSIFFKEVLRFPFTKLSIYLIFCFAVFFSYFHFYFLQPLHNRFKDNPKFLFFSYFYVYAMTGLLIIYALPAFNGNFISRSLQVRIPQEYAELYEWFKNRSNGRVLGLPIHTLFGWTAYDWKSPGTRSVYQGAGFVWFGLKQPILNREFDRWYSYNEQNYRELSYAVYSQNLPLFEKLLMKYNIHYLMLDENIINPGGENDKKKLFNAELKKMFEVSKNITFVGQFGEKIFVYDFTPLSNRGELYLLKNAKNVYPPYRWNYLDAAYVENGDYITEERNNSNIVIYPARQILNEQEKVNTHIMKIENSTYEVRIDINSEDNGRVTLPDLQKTETEVYTEVYANTNGSASSVTLDFLLPSPQNKDSFKQTFNLPAGTESMFSINDYLIRLPTSLSNQPIYIGETITQTKTTNALKTYDTTTLRPFPVDIAKIYPYLCSEVLDNQVYGGESFSASLNLFGKRSKSCIDVRLSEIIPSASAPQNGLIKFTFDYSMPSQSTAKFCFFDEKRGECLVEKTIPPSATTFEEYLPFDTTKAKNLFLKFTFDTVNATSTKTLVIDNIDTSIYGEETVENFNITLPPLMSSTENFTLSGKFPHNQIEVPFEQLTAEKRDCSVGKAKSINKKIVPVNGKNAVEYDTVDGTLCDALSFTTVSQDTGYLLQIDSQFISGLPMKICLEDDTTKLCVLEDELSKNRIIGSDYFIVPPYYNKGGYHLIIRNVSIGNTRSINRLQGVKLIPFPYTFFQSVKWTPDDSATTASSATDLSQFEIIKHYPFLYTVDADSVTPGQTLVLDQAFEKNWKAFVVSRSMTNTPVLKLISPLFGTELKDHVLVNNWANGWKVNEDVPGDKVIVVMFFPQYLLFVGLGFMIVAIILIFRYKRLSYTPIHHTLFSQKNHS